MKLTYGSVELNVHQIVSWERKAVYDSINYVKTENVLRVLCIWNPAVNAFRTPGETPARDLGIAHAPVTDNSLRHFLLIPRQRLTLTCKHQDRNRLVDTDVVLIDEAGNFDLIRDVGQGPRPIACNVSQNVGNKSWFIDYTISFDTIDRSLFDGKAGSVLLSHNFEQVSEIDEQFLEVITTVGRAIFSNRGLTDIDRYPDDYRKALFQPLRKGFRRESVQVRFLPGDVELEYRIVDRQVAVSWPFPNITKIEAGYSSAETQKGWAEAVMIGGGALLGAASDIAGIAGDRFGTNKKVRIVTQGIGRVSDAVMKLLPNVQAAAVVKVWGSPKATRKEMVDAAEKIINSVGGWVRGKMGRSYNLETTLQFDLTGRYVEAGQVFYFPAKAAASGDSTKRVESTIAQLYVLTGGRAITAPIHWLWGGVHGVAAGILQAPTTNLFQTWPDEDVTRPHLEPDHAKHHTLPGLLGPDRARGTRTERIIAGILSDPGIAPGKPQIRAAVNPTDP